MSLVLWTEIPKNAPHPKHPGLTLNQTLSYKKHLKTTEFKINTGNNIIHKLSSTLSQLLCKNNRPKFNETMEMISGWLKSTSPYPHSTKSLQKLPSIRYPLMRDSQQFWSYIHSRNDNCHYLPEWHLMITLFQTQLTL